MVFTHDYHLLNEQLLNIGSVSTVSELQGFFCGQYCVKPAKDSGTLMNDAVNFLDLAHFALSEEQLAVVEFVRKETQNRLGDDDFSFELLLPGDELSPERRSEELAAWCRGYLHGFGSAGLPKDAKIAPDVAEILKDFAKICQVEPDEGDSADEVEANLTELVEYLRAGLYTVQAEMKVLLAAKTEDEPPTNLH